VRRAVAIGVAGLAGLAGVVAILYVARTHAVVSQTAPGAPSAAVAASPAPSVAAPTPLLRPRPRVADAPRVNSPVVPHERLPHENDDDYGTRMHFVGRWDAWVKRQALTSAQVEGTLRVLADAKANYIQAEDARAEAFNAAIKLQDARMTPEQRKRFKDASMRAALAMKNHDPNRAAIEAEASVEMDKVSEELLTGLETPAEQRANAEAKDLLEGRNLQDEAVAALEDVLTPAQLKSFVDEFGGSDFDIVLRLVIHTQDELASR
jgi:hypothetical protein